MNRVAIRTWIPIAAMSVVLLVALFLGRGTASTTFAARAERIASGIKCAVCQGQTIAESKAPSARAIYDEITRQVEAGKSDRDIRGFIAGRYGTELLLRPPSSGVGSIVWIAPVVLGVLALGGLAAAFVKWKPTDDDDLSDADRALVARARRLAVLDPDPDGDLVGEVVGDLLDVPVGGNV